MTVLVRSITLNAGAGTVAAIVTATSRKRLKGQSVARIQIRLLLAALGGESPAATRERVRDGALRFLDEA